MKYIKLPLVICFIVILHMGMFKSGLIENFDYKIYDAISSFIMEEDIEKKSSVLLVDIDEKSLQHLGQWPWSRLIVTQLLNSINKYHPTSVGFDIIFPEPDKTSPNELVSFYERYLDTKISISGLNENLLDNDEVFAKGLLSSNSILSIYMTNKVNGREKCILPADKIDIKNDLDSSYEAQYVLCNIPKLQKSSSNVGFINFNLDEDGIFRRLPTFVKFEDKLIPSFALANIMSADKVSLDKNSVSILNHTFKIGKDSNVLLQFYKDSWYQRISAIDILSGKLDKNIIKGKFILIGASAAGLKDMVMVSSGEVISGVSVHATFIDNFLNDELVYQQEEMKNINFILSFIFSLFLLYLTVKQNHIKLVILFVSSIFLSLAFGYYFLINNIYISVGYFLVPLLIQFSFLGLIFIFFHYRDRQYFYTEILHANSSTIDSMALVVETRDTETGAHIIRTKEYIKILGEYLYANNIYQNILTKKFKEILYIANPLHDIGKVGIPDNILTKPGKLTYEEYEIMKNHPMIGKKILDRAMDSNKNNDFLIIAKNIAYSHHEKWDGSGYPQGLKAENIPLEARLMAIADVYDALISRRYYKDSFEYSYAEKTIIEGRGSHFDPLLIDAFIELKDKFKFVAESIGTQ